MDIKKPSQLLATAPYALQGRHRLVCAVLVVGALSLAAVHATTEPDLDSDGVPDVRDLDQDNDGIVNLLEGVSRLQQLSESPAPHYEVLTAGDVSHQGASYTYTLLDTDSNAQMLLRGKVLSSDTDVEWTMHESKPKIRNLGSGQSAVEWSFGVGRTEQNIDLTISDLDGIRQEAIIVSLGTLVGYSLSLNSNVRVTQGAGEISFVGTGIGGDSVNDSVALHIRDTSKLVLSYSNSLSDGASADSEIAGFRHSFAAAYSVRQGLNRFYPLTQARDTDADGIADYRDLDSDNDGIGDVIESGGQDANGDNIMDGSVTFQGVPVNVDSNLTSASIADVYLAELNVEGDDPDKDGILSTVDDMPDRFGGSRAGLDSDSDGLYDLDEIRVHHTDPYQPDTDQDGLTDLSELQRYFTDPLLVDTDGDGLTDGDELLVFNTTPLSVDTDLDGITDSAELAAGTDPLQAVIVMPEASDNQASESDLVTPIENADGSDISSVIADDPMQPTGFLATGVGGAAGCSIMSTSRDPSLPLWLFVASLYLTVRKRNV